MAFSSLNNCANVAVDMREKKTVTYNTIQKKTVGLSHNVIRAVVSITTKRTIKYFFEIFFKFIYLNRYYEKTLLSRKCINPTNEYHRMVFLFLGKRIYPKMQTFLRHCQLPKKKNKSHRI